MGELVPSGGFRPSWSQIYLLDGREEQLDARLLAFGRGGGSNGVGVDAELRRSILSVVQDCLAGTNPFVQAFANNAYRIREDASVTLRLRVANPSRAVGGESHHVYSRPTADEVAALVPVSSEERVPWREVIV
ncbi:hypothetical protein K402DRAFT_300195 [Neofusicoccum parvum]|uniref:Uncharacterized protein n=1 Tax=Neofusicoccum parvum TaxID=310453 RepID=A0ACB5SES1_9PEZI|nr:hypothetical protein K402DRAFT_300195 [Neofusicoccum parvum]